MCTSWILPKVDSESQTEVIDPALKPGLHCSLLRGMVGQERYRSPSHGVVFLMRDIQISAVKRVLNIKADLV